MKTKVYAESRAPNGPQSTELGEPTPLQTKAPARKGAGGWLVPTGLILLAVFPMITGALRLRELAGGPQVMPANAAFVATPLPVVVHIVAATVFALLGALQFGAGFRRRWPRWHRVAGRVLEFLTKP